MKKAIAAGLSAIILLGFTACGNTTAFEDKKLDVPTIELISSSVNEDGKLLTVCAADNGHTNPAGQNQSPGLQWDTVEDAGSYVVVMFDEDANWLHWLTSDVLETVLEQGAFMQSSTYIGPYPPKSTGRHHYRIEVFAVRGTPDDLVAKMNATNNYADIVSSIDVSSGEPGNILARGHIECTYENGDNTY